MADEDDTRLADRNWLVNLIKSEGWTPQVFDKYLKEVRYKLLLLMNVQKITSCFSILVLHISNCTVFLYLCGTETLYKM